MKCIGTAGHPLPQGGDGYTLTSGDAARTDDGPLVADNQLQGGGAAVCQAERLQEPTTDH